MLEFPGSKTFKATTGGRKLGHRPPVVILTRFIIEFCNFFFRSNYIKSGWCMEEFLVAHEQTVSKKTHFLIPVLVENLDRVELKKHPELELYIKTHTYIDATKLKNENLVNPLREIAHLRKRIR